MDVSSYGRLVEGGSGGNFATGGYVQSTGFMLVGERGCEIVFASRGDYIRPAAGLVSRLDTSADDPEDGTAGVPAKVR